MSGWGKDSRRSDRFAASKRRYEKHGARTKKDKREPRIRPAEDGRGSFPLTKTQLKEHTVYMKEMLENYSNTEYIDKTLYYPEETDYPIFNVNEDAIQPKLIFAVDNVVDYTLKHCIDDDSVAILNFASAKNPGGAFSKGSGGLAQEEAINYSSGLYQALIDGVGSDMYYQNRKDDHKCLYRNDLIMSPNVPFFYDGQIKKLDNIIYCSIYTCPAVNYKQYMIKSKAKDPHTVAFETMKERIDKLLSIALTHGHTKLILGPWGCGVFGGNINDLMNHIYTSPYFKGFDELHFISLKEETVDEMKHSITMN